MAAQATRAHILDTARDLFNAHPYADVGIRTIAKAAGVSTGAVFTYWDDKPALYLAAIGHAPITPEQGRALLALAVQSGVPNQAWRIVNG